MYYLSLPFLLLFLTVLQNRISDILFFGIVGIEISLILVIYAGFRFDVIRGGVLSFLLGFFVDCITGSVSGLHAFIYVAIFLISLTASAKISLTNTFLIMAYTAVCAILKSTTLALLYPFAYGIYSSAHTLKVFIPQILIVTFISPLFFHLFSRIEALLNGGNAQQFERI